MAEKDATDPKEIFNILVSDHESKIKHPNPQFYSNLPYREDPITFFKKHPKYFTVFEDDAGEPCIVGARFPLLKVCLAYGPRNSYCNRADCRELHLCREHVSGYCAQAVDCRKDHHFQSDHNKTILRALSLTDHQQDALMSLVRMCVPQVCRSHNRAPGGCQNRDTCTRFHVCTGLVQGHCADETCQKVHNFDSDHSKRLLKAFELDAKSKKEVISALWIHRIKYKGVDRNYARIADDLRDLLIGRESDSEDSEKDTVKDWFSFPTKESFDFNIKSNEPSTTKLSKNDDSDVWTNLQGSIDEMAMIQEALGDDDLMTILDYQIDFDRKQEACVPTEEVAEEATTKTEEPDLQHNEDTIVEADKADEALADIPKQVPMPMYDGYAPQGDKILICDAYLKNECKEDAETCSKVHFISPYLWQIQVDGIWFNLDTINEDIEKSYKKLEMDYITNVPNEVPNLAGDLVTVVFKTLNAKLLDAPNSPMTKNFAVRRIGSEQKAFGLPRYRDRDVLVQRRDRLAHLFPKKTFNPRPKMRKRVPPTIPAVVTETAFNVAKKDDVKPAYKWQVKSDDQWHDLTQASDEIEEAFKDRAPDYTTMFLAETKDMDDEGRLIEIVFKDMTATFLDTNNTTQIQRIPLNPEKQNLVEERIEPSTIVGEIIVRITQQEETVEKSKDDIPEIEDDTLVTKVLPKETIEEVEHEFLLPVEDFEDELEESEKIELQDTSKVEDDEVINIAASENEPNHTEPIELPPMDEDAKPKEQLPQHVESPQQTVEGDEHTEEHVANYDGSNDEVADEPLDYVWQWSDDFHTWRDHTEEVSRCLETAHTSGRKSGKIKINGEKIKINFVEMTQLPLNKKVQFLKRLHIERED